MRLLEKELSRYRKERYESLLRLLKEQDDFEVTAPSGTVYQVEIQAVWKREKNGDLMVCGAIDDEGIRAFAPLTMDFIIRPDGTFVGE
jgi:nucleotide-binding universal stress UspA family protein